MGPTRRLQIHDIGHAVEQFDADVVCLQEVRSMHRREQRHFARWPAQPQADFLAPEGYEVAYRSNAVTHYGEHGNAVRFQFYFFSICICKFENLQMRTKSANGFCPVLILRQIFTEVV